MPYAFFIMLQVNDVTLQFGSRVLFDRVNLSFTSGNCYGVIGANGAGKSTFLRVLSGELEPNKGDVTLKKNSRMSVLAQNQNAFDEHTVLRTVLMGHKRLVEIKDAMDALYAKPDFSDEDGNKVSELGEEFAELGGWEAEAEAESLLDSLKVPKDLYEEKMSDVDPKVKVKVLLAQALFGSPDIMLLDEPTNNLDAKSVHWLENYLMGLNSTIIIVSHNRHFLNKVCTHICDVDFKEINVFVGNYDFWYETSQLIARQAKEQNKKAEARAKELADFIARFSANAARSKQATSRKKELERLKLEDIKPSNRKYPYIDFKPDREPGNDILVVEGLTLDGYFNDISFIVGREDKIAFLCSNGLVVTELFNVIAGIKKPSKGTVKWGTTITSGYLPLNNDSFFDKCSLKLTEWLGQFSKDNTEIYLRSWLGRMLFSGEEALKKASVLSGGEKVRCMLARCMLAGANFLIMDEPTNHLDLEAITALNKGMTNFKGAMLFTTHDHEIMSTVANRIIEIDGGKKAYDKIIGYDEYLEKS